VPHRRRQREEIEVRLAAEHEVPIGEVEEARDAVASQRVELRRGREHCRVERDRREHEEQRGEQPARPARPERRQIDVATPAELGDQQRRDQVTRQDEEGVDAEEAARGPSGAEVVRDDGCHGERAQAVECRLISDPGLAFHGSPDPAAATDGTV
jgi:hypothetical protein